MRRRDFIALVGGAAVAPPLVARAQRKKVPKIGVLVTGNPEPAPFLRLFREALRDLGYIDGKTVLFEYRSAEGNVSLLPDLAKDLVRLKVDVIVVWHTPVAHAASQATREIPIVMADVGDPVGTGLIPSLARPGGNVTGLAGITAELAGKIIQLIREMWPATRRVAVMLNSPDPFSKPFSEHIHRSAQMVGVDIHPFPVRGNDEFEAAFPRMSKERMEVVIVQPSLPAKHAAELALKYRLPAASVSRWFAEEGGLLSYSAKLADLYREAAAYVDKVLKGAKPADLPVQQPKTFELLINLKTARAIGVTIPQSMLARADEIIQ